MARYTRVFASIWTSGDDWIGLTADAQRLYFLLITQSDISHCGVLPLTERRWGRLAVDTDTSSVRSALQELSTARFIVVDELTEEVLVRSHIKWDGQWSSPNGMKAIEKACSHVLSEHLASIIADTLHSLGKGASEGAWQGASEGDASLQQPTTNNQQPTTRAKKSSHY